MGPNEMISESAVHQWLTEVKNFRHAWAEFALSFQAHFDAFRDMGASLPESFFPAYSELQQRKAAMSARIAERTQQFESKDWTAPLPTDSLHEFELRLRHLIDIIRDPDCIAAETRARFQKTLADIQKLHCPDIDVDRKLCSVRQDANSVMQSLATQPFRIMDQDLDKKMCGFEALLVLVNDGPAHSEVRNALRPRMDASQALTVFLTVQDQFGLALAVEALRGGFSLMMSTFDVAGDHSEVLNTARTLTDADPTSPACVMLFETSQSWLTPVTSEQISDLLK
jgi:hypothetical protein